MGGIRVPDTNMVVLAGRITKEPLLKYTQSGSATCKISVANTRYYRDKSGEGKQEVTYADVVLWGDAAERAAQYEKGRPVIVEGRLKTESWNDKTTGQVRSKLALSAQRVVPLDWDGESGEKPERQPKAPAKSKGVSDGDYSREEDDIPF